MGRKYRLTEQTIKWKGKTLYRIQALKDFRYVKAGDLGGYVESELNLSHEGTCWVFDNAKVWDRAGVLGNAHIRNNTQVYERAVVYGDVEVRDNVEIFGGAQVYDCASISGKVEVSGSARVYETSLISNAVKICGNAWIHGNLYIDQYVRIRLDADIHSFNDFIVIGSIGSRDGNVVFFKCRDNKIGVSCGCFSGYIDEFSEQVEKNHGNDRYGEEYRLAIKIAKIRIPNT